ncbi:MAG: nucleoside phosphorylase [Nitrospira sp.]|jgi:nucleoside phosphorylase|nr:nucleoside phosphorylase [Nitrospira sp.]
MNIGLVAEVKWEVREVCRRLKLELLDARDEIWGAEHNGHTIRLCLSGMVPAVSKERVDRFLDSQKLDLMICSGLAGALKPHIHIGELIVQSENSRLIAVAEQALKRQSIPFHVGPLVTVSLPVLTPAARRALAATTPAIAVDMESQTIATLCKQRNIPCLAIKGVSDGLDDDLSPILGGFDIIDIPRIAMWVLVKPQTWPLAARLARHSYRSANNLGHGVWAALQGMETSIHL